MIQKTAHKILFSLFLVLVIPGLVFSNGIVSLLFGASSEVFSMSGQAYGAGATIYIKTPYQNGGNWWKGMVHLHTSNSTDATRTDTPTVKVNYYKNAGYNFVAITDHEVVTPDPGVTGLVIIHYAEEVTKSWGHMGAIGISSTRPLSLSPQAVIDEIRSLNGISVMNHPNFPLATYTNNELQFYLRYQGIEIQDTFVDWGWNNTGDAVSRWDFALSTTNRQIWAFGTDDNHDSINQPIDKNCIMVSTPANTLTQADIMKSLWGGDFYVTKGSAGPKIQSVTVSGSTITVKIPTTQGGSHVATWIGNNGQVLRSAALVSFQDSYVVNGEEKYVRCEITRFDGLKVWIQPLWILKSTGPVNIITTSLPDATIAADYNQGLTAFGGIAPYTWSLATETNLPPGLSLSSTGIISGTAALEGDYRFRVIVTDSTGGTFAQDLWLSVKANLFEDNFSGNLGKWTIVDDGTMAVPSRWQITSGQLVQSSNIWDGVDNKAFIEKRGTYAYAGNTSWHNYEYSLKTKSTDDDGLGVMFRYLDNNNYYRFSMDKQRSYRRIVKKVNGVYSTLTEDSIPYTQGSTYNLKVSVIENRIIVSLDNNLVFDVFDPQNSLPKGKIALYCWGNANGIFDDVVVSPNLPLTITTDSLPDGKVGVSYSANLFSYGGRLPYTWGLASGSNSLPPGLTLSLGGSISGTPLVSGLFGFTIQVTDGFSSTAMQPVSINVAQADPLVITNNGFANGIVSFPYTGTLDASGGVKPYTFSISSGNLPNGLTLSESTIIGTPLSTTTVTFTVQAQDYLLTQTTKKFTMIIDPTPPILYYDNFSTTSLGGWTKVENGQFSKPAGWSVLNGALYQSSNIWDGNDDPTDPVKAGTYCYNGDTSWTDYTLTFQVKSDDNDTFGVMFRYQDDNNYYRYSIDAERFYRRLIKKVNGVITVLAEDIGENSYSPGRWYNMKVVAVGDNIKIYSDGELVYDVIDHSLLNGKIAMYTWADQGVSFDEILVTGLGKLTITATAPPNGNVGYPYDTFITVAGGPTPYTWSLDSGTLPDGLYLNTTNGEIYGTPTIESTFNFTIKVQDTTGSVDYHNYTVDILPTPFLLIITPSTLPQGIQGKPYFYMVQASGGITPYSWSVPEGLLPEGLTLNTFGEISGTPLASETSFLGFTVRVQDSVNNTNDKAMTLLVSEAKFLVVTTQSLSFGVTNESYYSQLSGYGGVLPYSWSIYSGQLPPGLSLDSTGQITGIPTQSTTANFIVQLTDSAAPSTTVFKPLFITVFPALFQNHFDAGTTTLNGWTIIDEGTISKPSKWSITSTGELIQSSDIFGGAIDRDTPDKLGTYIVTGSLAWTDYQINLKMNSGDDDSFGVIFRYQDNDNYYRFSMDSQRRYRRIVKKVNGVFSTLADDSGIYAKGQWYNVTINAAQDKIKVILDNQKIFDIRDDSLLNGKFGLYTWGCLSTRFDDIIIIPSPVFYDDFTNGKDSTWQAVDDGGGQSTWEAPNGILRQTSNTFSGSTDRDPIDKPGTYLYNGDTSWTNYELAAQMRSADDDGIGMMFRYQDNNNYYRFSMDAQRYYRRLVKKVNGVYTLLAEDSVSYDTTRWYTVKAQAAKNNIKILIDDIPIFNVNDNSFANGKIAMYAWGNPRALYDNAAVNILPILKIDSNTLSDGTVGYPYLDSLVGSGGNPPYNWSIYSGLLPDGLSLSTTGTIFGTPSTAGLYNFTTQIQDQVLATDTKAFSIFISPPPAPVITTDSSNEFAPTSLNLPIGSVNVPYTANFTATGGIPPYTWSIVSGTLPDGLTVTTTGFISGTPTVPGTFYFIAQVIGTQGVSTTKPLSIIIDPPPATVFFDTFSTGFSGWTIVDDGTLLKPSGWSVITGLLQQNSNIYDGDLNPDTLPKLGTYAYTGSSTWQDYEFSARLRSTDNDRIGVIFRYVDGNNYYRFSLDNERPGRWLVKKVNGVYTLLANDATPYAMNQWFTVKIRVRKTNIKVYVNNTVIFDVSDSSLSSGKVGLYCWGNTLSQFDDVQVATIGKVNIITNSLPNGTQSYTYNTNLIGQGGTLPYTWNLMDGNLPPGLTLSTSGSISGIPTVTGTYPFVAGVTDNALSSDSMGLSITVQPTPPVTITSNALTEGTVTRLYNATVLASGGFTPYTWSLSSGALPDGLSLNSTSGVISGTPTSVGTSRFIIQVSDSNAGMASKELSLVIIPIPPLVITSNTLALGTVNSGYNQELTTIGGVPPYTWSTASGNLPIGVSLSSTGFISGTPLSSGSSNFVVQVRDNISTITTKPLSIIVLSQPQILLSDDFSDGSLAWTRVDEGTGSSSWSAPTGVMIQTSNIWGGSVDRNEIPKPGTYAYRGSTTWTDYEYTLNLQSGDDDGIGIMFRMIDDNNYYRFSMDKERFYRRLVKNVNGTFTLLAEDSTAYVKNQWYSIKVRVIGSSIQIYLDDVLVFDVTDADIQNGMIALYCWGNAPSNFDNVVVKTIPQ